MWRQTTLSSCGMLCPASATATRSPGRTSSTCQRSSEPRLSMRTRRSSSWTGASCSSGVIRPVRPMRNSTSRTSVSALRSGYFRLRPVGLGLPSAGGRCSGAAPRHRWRTATLGDTSARAPVAGVFQCLHGLAERLRIGKPSAASCPSRAFMLSAVRPVPDEQADPRGSVPVRPLLAMAPATRPRAPALPCDAWTCRSSRQ